MGISKKIVLIGAGGHGLVLADIAKLNGYDEIQGMIISFLASVPNGSFEVERVTCTDRPNEDGYDVAVRWRLRGINEGIGFFGQPSGKPLDIMGINHYHVLNGKVKEEWMTFDGLDVLKQMAMGSDEQEE